MTDKPEQLELGLFTIDETGDVAFERLSQENGTRFWFARDYMNALGYNDWPQFKKKVLNRALAACAVLGYPLRIISGNANDR